MAYNLDEILGGIEKIPGVTTTTGGKVSNNELSNKYVEVPKNKLATLPLNTYIRYRDSTGALKPGGGKVREILTIDKEQYVRLYNYNVPTKKHFNWKVKLADMSKIYRYVRDNDDGSSTAPIPTSTASKNVKPTTSQANSNQHAANSTTSSNSSQFQSEEDQLLSQLGEKMLFNDNDLLKQKVELLEAEVNKLATDQKKMLNIIKRLHNTIYQNSAPSAE